MVLKEKQGESKEVIEKEEGATDSRFKETVEGVKRNTQRQPRRQVMERHEHIQSRTQKKLLRSDFHLYLDELLFCKYV